MNDLEMQWLQKSQNRGRHDVLASALENGFVLFPLASGPVLIWGGEVAQLSELQEKVDKAQPTKGERAYGLRLEHMKWRHVADAIGFTASSNACLVAKRYARQKGLPWPPV